MKKTDLQTEIEKNLEKYRHRYYIHRGMSLELDMMYLRAIQNLEDMLANEILEQELFDD